MYGGRDGGEGSAILVEDALVPDEILLVHVGPGAAGKIAGVAEHPLAHGGSRGGHTLCLHGRQGLCMALPLVSTEVLQVEVRASACAHLAGVGFGRSLDRDWREVLWSQAVTNPHVPDEVFAVHVGLAAVLVLAGELLDELFASL